MENELYQIGQLGELAGLSNRTIRYYQEIGLIEPSQISEGGFRLFNKKDLHRLQVIEVYKKLGFELKEIQKLLPKKNLNNKSDMIDYSRKVLLEQIDSIEKKINELREIKSERINDLSLLTTCEKCKKKECPPECKSKAAYV